MKRLIAVILSLIIMWGSAFAISVLFVYVISWCFGFEFSLKLAVGTWLLLAFLKFWFMKGKDE